MMIWFKTMRLRTKIILIVLSSMALLIGGYVGVRFIQYQHASAVSLEQFLPLNPEAVCVLRQPRALWQRMKETEPFLVVQNGILKDPVMRSQVSAILSGFGLPTLDEFSDRRVAREWEPYLNENFIFRFFEDRAAMAVVVGPSGRAEFLALGQLSFSDFLLWPFAPLAAKGIHFESDRFDMALGSHGKIWGSVQGNAVLIATSPDLLENAMKQNGLALQTERPIYVSASVDGSRTVGNFVRRWAAQVPGSILTQHLDLTAFTRVDIDADVLKRDILVRLRLHGARMVNPDLLPATRDMLSFAPSENTFFVQPFLGDISVLWHHIDAAPASPNSGGDLNVFRPFWDLLRQHRIDQRLFPHLSKGILIMAGNEMGQGNREGEGPFPALGLVFRIKENEGKKVSWVMEEVTKKIIGDYENISMASTDYKGQKMYFFYTKIDPFKMNSIFRPCYAVVKDHLVLTTSLPYMEAILDCVSGEGIPFQESALYKHMNNGISTPDAKNAPVMAAGLNVHELGTGLIHLAPISASYAADNDDFRRRVRESLKNKHPRQPFQSANDYENFLDDKVREAVRDEERDTAQKLRDRIRVLEYIQFVTARTEPADDGVVLEMGITPGKK